MPKDADSVSAKSDKSLFLVLVASITRLLNIVWSDGTRVRKEFNLNELYSVEQLTVCRWFVTIHTVNDSLSIQFWFTI